MASLRFYKEIRHQGLLKYQVISGLTSWGVDQKATMQLAAWGQEWDRRRRKEHRQALKRSEAQTKDEKKAYAVKRTKELEAELDSQRRTLESCLQPKLLVDWNALKTKHVFFKPPPIEPSSLSLPREPETRDAAYQVHLTLIDHLLVFPKKRKRLLADARYQYEHTAWRKDCDDIRAMHENDLQDFRLAAKSWRDARDDFELREQARIESARSLEDDYRIKKPSAIAEYCELVLTNSSYPENFPRSCEIEYKPYTRILLVEYALPAPEHLPRLKEIRYIQARDELQEILFSESEQTRLYDELLYQIILRSIFELYQSDQVEAIDSVIFNGFVQSIDRTTGNEVNPCVLSLQANRREFLAINLARVDPKACFKKLEGIGKAKLIGLAPIAPIMEISREDARFIPSHDVVDGISPGFNIAAMDWEEFEHFIREVFSKEFDKGGGEVKVTRASRDGGVDAIAFDPDPIRGGKIVIQAKRYTNTVEVSAVRDLYGTVMNEGASKGILVTTADYGPDSYQFARGKPLTLINGNELLFLLQKHGHSARIDLKEAKKLLAEQKYGRYKQRSDRAACFASFGKE